MSRKHNRQTTYLWPELDGTWGVANGGMELAGGSGAELPGGAPDEPGRDEGGDGMALERSQHDIPQ